jgi:hypothetical protein
MTTSSPNDILQMFTTPELSGDIEKRPDRELLQRIKDEQEENAAGIFSQSGTGRHGHTVIVLTEDEWEIKSGNTAHPKPPNPGRAPVIPSQLTNARQIEQLRASHSLSLHEFTLWNNVESALKKQLSKAIHRDFYEAIIGPGGFSEITLQDMYIHLFANYGNLTDAEIERNTERMERQWEPNENMEGLFKQLKAGAELVKTRETYTDFNLMRMAVKNIDNSGVHTPAIRDWNMKPEADKTFDKCRDYFLLAEKVRSDMATTQTPGYANAATKARQSEERNAEVQVLFQAAIAEWYANQASANIGNPGAPPPAPVPAPTQPRIQPYCWTHGIITNIAHTSMNCNHKAPGHQDGATFNNKMGGSTTTFTRRTNGA